MFVDMGAFEMSLNIHESSIAKHGIDNYLFLSTNRKLCQEFISRRINCFVFGSDPDSDEPSEYLHKDFVRKMNIRTSVLIDVLSMGYSILHTDTDVVFFDDPYRHLPCLDGGSDCDMAVMWDWKEFNAGFFFVRPTTQSIALLQSARRMENDRFDDQQALNAAIAIYKAKGNLGLRKLPQEKFQCGR